MTCRYGPVRGRNLFHDHLIRVNSGPPVSERKGESWVRPLAPEARTSIPLLLPVHMVSPRIADRRGNLPSAAVAWEWNYGMSIH
jgi:hypothetical protein